MAEEKTEKAGVFALIFSFLFPIVGIICYFCYRKGVVNASSYLWCAVVGIAIGLLLRSIA